MGKQQQKPDPKNMVKIGDLRKIVANLKKRQAQLDYDLDGVEISDVNTKPLFIERDANEKRIDKYQGILNKFDKENPDKITSLMNSVRDLFTTSKSDSLMNEYGKKMKMANSQEAIGKAQIRNKVKEGSMTNPGYGDIRSAGAILPVGKQRIEIANKLRASAKQDSVNAVKLKNK